jgi:hypothetical protein
MRRVERIFRAVTVLRLLADSEEYVEEIWDGVDEGPGVGVVVS